MTEAVKRVYAFGKDANGNNVTEGNTEMKWVLGGKGANLAEMANIGLPVPPGFTITCQTCMEYANAGNVWPEGALDTIAEYRADLEERMGKRLGDAEDPLLVSVRSGAPFSMPGMMDTVLNLGLNDESINGLIKQTDNPRFAWDSYRRFIQMFSNVVMGLDGDLFENAIVAMKNDRGVASDTDLTAEDLQELVDEFKAIFAENVDGEAYPSLVVDGAVAFPQDPMVQLQLAIEAVFGSWNNPRAVLYRQKEKIADDLGTAVNVQSMVFGNKGDTSATGVAFTRNPANGEREFYGDYLVNAQGEDVVAGIRNTSPIADLKTVEGLEEAGAQLEEVFDVLENHFRDMCDIEFTIEQGKLWMLQTRAGKRTAAAALRIAIEMEKEGLITKEEAVMRVAPEQLDQLLHPQFDKNATYDVVARGLNASPGAAVGEAVFSAADAVAAAEAGRKCVLVRWETNPDDLAGMIAAEGILTSHGGKTSPRGRYRPRHGRAVRVRRGGAEDRRRQEGGRHRRHRPGHPRGRHDLHRRHHGHCGARRGGAGACPSSPATWTPSWSGPTRSAPWVCAPTPTTPRTPSSPATSAPRASACAAPSTCSWATASRSSRRSS